MVQTADIKLMRTFVGVADAGGLSAAQIKLNRSLTAISADLQALEDRLGGKLCKRGRSGFALTEFGLQVYEASRTLFQALDRFQQDVTPVGSHLNGALRLAVNDGQISDPDFPLSQALRRYCSRPNNAVRIGITVASFEQILEGLLNDTFDVGMGFFSFDHPSLERFELHEERNLLYCGRRHPLFEVDDAALTTERVLASPAVMRAPRPSGDHPAVFADTVAAAIGKTPSSRAYLILSGCYLGYLAEHQARRWVEAGEMRPVLPDVFGFHTTMELAVRASADRPKHVASFLKDFFEVVSAVRAGGPQGAAAPTAASNA